jgi:hypothetical protein
MRAEGFPARMASRLYGGEARSDGAVRLDEQAVE